ncbi:MAG: acetate--CoA ligase family protein [Pseudomonadota bacterium]
MEDLSRLLQPESVVYIGGAQISGPIRAARRAGYQGDMYVVNPRRDTIEELVCYASVTDLPVVPDAAVVGLSAERSIVAVQELADGGCGGAVVMSSGYAELNTDEGRERQRRLVAAAGNMPLLGPNCMGLMNQFSGAFVWGDDNHCERQSGPAAAIISQSGALLIGMTGIETAFPLGYAVSIGNQSVTSTADLIEAILNDSRIKAIGLYLEGMNEGSTLGDACYRALQQRVPVIALKGGDQAAGAAVAQSHTASMVVERDLWNAFKHRYGVVEVSSPKALVESLKLLTTAGVARGNRLSICSYSGGLNGLAATRCAQMGIELPMPAAANHQWLAEQFPETVTIANPLDLNVPYAAPQGTLSMQDTDGVAESIIRFAADVSDQIVFFIDVPRPGAGVLDRVWCDSLQALIRVKNTLGIPVSVAGILPGGLPQDFCLQMQSEGIPCLHGYSETMEALQVSLQVQNHFEHLTRKPAALLSGTPIEQSVLLDEAESKAELHQCGLVCARHRVAAPADAAAAAQQLGYPVALKILSNRIAHKARIGGVKLNIKNEEQLAQNLDALCSSVTGAGYAADKVLVEKMVTGATAEVIVGVKRHAALGLALMIGKGGSNVEETAEFETLLLPCTDQQINAVLECLQLHKHCAAEALLKACSAVAAYAQANQHTLASLDVNPVMLTASGEAIAADALIEKQV